VHGDAEQDEGAHAKFQGSADFLDQPINAELVVTGEVAREASHDGDICEFSTSRFALLPDLLYKRKHTDEFDQPA
jgi:hypothetical protein